MRKTSWMMGAALCFLLPLCLLAQEKSEPGQELGPQKLQDPIVLDAKKINLLNAVDARQTPGIRQFGPQGKLNAKKFWLTPFNLEDRIEWNILLSQSGAYDIDLLVNCKAGTVIRLACGNSIVDFTAKENGWQRTRVPEPLRLPQGRSSISLQMVAGQQAIAVKSIELVNVLERAVIEKRILAFKGDTQWMKEAGYGIMTQVGGWAYPRSGDKKPWPGFAEDFDVKAFVDKMRDMGAKYIVWSATWSDYLFPAPLQAIGEVLPARISRRDLIGELIAECQRYHIRVMLYYHLGHDHKDVLLAKGWSDAPEEDYSSRQVWLEREIKIFTEMGNRYGKGLDAIFLDDGCVWYPADFERLGAALKTGNAARLICYNPWIAPSLTPFQDFYCGEGFDGREIPYPISNGNVTSGPQKGLQLFGNFIFDGPEWGINQPGVVIRSPKEHGWTADKIVEMTHRLEKEKYSIALNVLVYEDGTIGEDSYTMLRDAARKLKRGKWASPVKR